MRPSQRMRGGPPGFAGPQSMAARLAIALIAGSILYALTRESFGLWLMLIPDLVLTRFALWQPFTYVFMETTSMGVLFGALITWSIGGALEQSWGRRRLLLFAVGSTVIAGVATVGLALLAPGLRTQLYAGGTVMTTVLWVGYGLAHARSQINFWGLPLTGNVFALIGVGFVFLNGAFSTWSSIIPDAMGVLITLLYVRTGLNPRIYWLRIKQWWYQRQLRSRSKHLKVISKDRNTSDDSDRFLH